MITSTLKMTLLLQMVSTQQLPKRISVILISLIFLDNLITSKGPATAYAFGLAIVEKLVSKEEAAKVAKGLLYTDYKWIFES